MPRRNTKSDASKIKAGYGQGSGKDYKPYTTVRDFGSCGVASRMKSRFDNRVMHFHSGLEASAYHIYEKSLRINHVYEQFPLPVETTQEIAERLGIKHPSEGNKPFVMTTDFVIDCQVGNLTQRFVRTCKYAEYLLKPRVIELFEIDRTYWTELGNDWGIVTEREIPPGLLHNLEWIRSAKHLEDRSDIELELICAYEEELHNLLASKSTWQLNKVCREFDLIRNFEHGSGLTLVQYLIGAGVWEVDLMSWIDVSGGPLVLQKRNLDAFMEEGRE